jgi:hypothetical protein
MSFLDWANAPLNEDEFLARDGQFERDAERHHKALERQAEAWFAGELAADPIESYNEYNDPAYLAEYAPLPVAAIPPAPAIPITRQQGELFDARVYKVA